MEASLLALAKSIYYWEETNKTNNGLGYDVVMNLMNGMFRQGYHLFVDNFYSSSQLFNDLYDKGCMVTGTVREDRRGFCSDEIHSCLRTFISNTARTATILNRDNTRRQCSKQYSRQCVETDQFWSLLRVNAQAANTR